jgi:hypothetical protein
MNEYHKIQTIFKRDLTVKGNPIIVGEYTLPEFAYLAHNKWVWTEKIDGTNIRVIFHDGKITFGGKTDNAQIPAPLIAVLQKLFLPHLSTFHNIFTDGSACLYGEGYGARIQKGGGNYRPDPGFVLFDVKVGDWWLERDNVEDVANKLHLDTVPLCGAGTLPELVEFTRSGFLSRWGAFRAEGIVARPEVELKTRSSHRIITKLKHRDFV